MPQFFYFSVTSAMQVALVTGPIQLSEHTVILLTTAFAQTAKRTVKLVNPQRRLFSLYILLSLVSVSSLAVSADFKGYSQPFVHTPNKPVGTDIPFRDAQGNLQRLTDYRDQVVLVNLWASWCSACIYEMPELNALQQELGDRGLKVLTLNQDLPDGKQALAFLQSKGYSHLTGHLDLNYVFGKSYGQTLLPMTLVFDTTGKQIGHLIGPAAWNSAEAKALLKPYLPN